MFEVLDQLPPDPILGLSAALQDDPNPNKVDLGVGVYKNEAGNTPVMVAVKQAEASFMSGEHSKAYLPPAGEPATNQSVLSLIYGANHAALQENRLRIVQTPGGCGGLRLVGELARRCNPKPVIWVSTPTWANHIPLFSSAGVEIKEYPYYDPDGKGVLFDKMLACLQQAGPGDLVLLHGCCHNPTGADLSDDQWQAVTSLALEKGFTPLIDLAYQGFGRGLEEDVYGLRLMAAQLPELMVVSSCSKNFGLYRERCGSLSLLSANASQADASHSQALSIARGNYSMPPAHGAAIVGTILGNSELNNLWQQELEEMRTRMVALRQLLVDQLAKRGLEEPFTHIRAQYGMFSFLGVSPQQVARLRQEFSIYMMDSSRINVAGISPDNTEYLADALAAVL
jgi:aspartate aminotransferase